MDTLPVIVASALIASLHAQTDRRLLAADEVPRADHAMAYDLAHGRCVLFGGFDGASALAATMLWDGRRWTAAAPTVQPPARSGHAMAYDVARSRVVLFGGRLNGTGPADTWLWDGSNWSQAQPAHVPPARAYPAMAYAWLTARTVLFGGNLGNNALADDTWEWDGTDWIQRLLPIHPTARYGHAMAYDMLRDKVVLFGGFGDDPATTWLYDGFAWTSVVTATSPPVGQRDVMAFDLAAGKTLLLKSNQIGSNATASGLWSWDGAQWTSQSTANALVLPSRYGAALAHDLVRSRTVMFGGIDTIRHGDTWEWDGTEWHTEQPPTRWSGALAFDTARGIALLFGGLAANNIPTSLPLPYLGDTWEWREGAWHLLRPASAPSGRVYCGITYDSIRKRTVLFGGLRSPSEFDETWLWDGARWNQHLGGFRPPPRQRPAMTFDAARKEVVMFGGMSTVRFAVFQDTWTFDGSTWTQKTTAVQPLARPAAAFAFDAARGRCVLFGGMPIASTPTLNDTWEWDGTNWIALAPVHAPSPRFHAAFCYDAARRRTVLIGGTVIGPATDEIWEWDGTDWTQRFAPGPVGPIAAMGVFDTVANRTLVFGSRIGNQPTSTTWSYGPVQPATLAPFGNGCVGSAGVPQLRAVDGALPWLGDTLALAVEPVPANAPVLLALGFSRTTFGGLALPASLDPLGMTGCTLFVSIDDGLLAFSNGARADFALQVPTTASLAGMQFFAQAAIGDAAANAAGIIASSALEGSIGAK